MNPQGPLSNQQGKLGEIEVDVSGAGDNQEKVEKKIRTFKECYRSVITRLPYRVPKKQVKDLLFYSAKRMNSEATVNSIGNVCAIVRLKGRKVEYDKEYCCGFGDYLETCDPAVRTNAEEPRTKTAIVLWPAGNMRGSWKMFNLSTGEYTTRTIFKKLSTTDLVIKKMNEWADASNDIMIKKADKVMAQEHATETPATAAT